MKETEVIDLLGQVWQEIRNHLEALASSFEVPEWLGDVARRAFECDGRDSRWLLPMQFCQRGFVVECIDVADRSGAVNHEDLLRGRLKGSFPRRVRLVGVDIGPDG